MDDLKQIREFLSKVYREQKLPAQFIWATPPWKTEPTRDVTHPDGVRVIGPES